MSKRVSRKDELRMLEEEAERLERMLNEVRKRIDELRK
jgi:malate/lactate dehydrogenase